MARIEGAWINGVIDADQRSRMIRGWTDECRRYVTSMQELRTRTMQEALNAGKRQEARLIEQRVEKDAALGKIEVFSARVADLLKFLGDGFVLQGFTRGRGLPEPTLRAADDGDAFEKRIRLFSTDRVELAHALLSGKLIHRAQIRIQRVEQLVDLLVSQNVLDFIERVDPKGKRNALALIELLQALVAKISFRDKELLNNY